MAGTHQTRWEISTTATDAYLSLVWLNKSFHEGVKVQQQQLVNADQPGDEVNHQQFDLKSFCGLLQLLEELLTEILRVVDEAEGGEVERFRSGLLLLVFVDCLQRPLQLLLPFLRLFGDPVPKN